MTDINLLSFDLPAVERKELTVGFDGGMLALRAAEKEGQRWSRLFGQIFRFVKWNLYRG